MLSDISILCQDKVEGNGSSLSCLFVSLSVCPQTSCTWNLWPAPSKQTETFNIHNNTTLSYTLYFLHNSLQSTMWNIISYLMLLIFCWNNNLVWKNAVIKIGSVSGAGLDWICQLVSFSISIRMWLIYLYDKSISHTTTYNITTTTYNTIPPYTPPLPPNTKPQQTDHRC